MPSFARRVESFSSTIFSEINSLAQQYNALNLGQGKPDFGTPPDIVAYLAQAALSGQYNQYAPGPGVPSLRQAVADHAARFYDMQIDPARGVVVTAGATEGVFCAVMGLVDAGDEVILIEPSYDSYMPSVVMAGAKPVFVPLHQPDWSFDPDELRAAFNNRTRALILNTPHNPTGRVFTREELSLIAQLCIEHDVAVISDEVYEHLLYDDARHIPIATLPGMFERTLTVSSAGKLFSATGWKIGWMYGAPEMVEGPARVHMFVTFAVHHPTQEAIAYALNLPDDYYTQYQAMYAQKRQAMRSALDDAGLRYSVPQGAYYVMVDYTTFFHGAPMDCVRYLAKEIGVACIPTETFYSPQHAHIGYGSVRFAFCKTDELLEQVHERLLKLRK
jgi:N-succinyldiaminopimelate aminotransferase